MKRLLYLVPLMTSVFSLSAEEIVPAVYRPGSEAVQISNVDYTRAHHRRHRRRVIRRRSRRRSAAIVGGSAAGGAAIGAIAGGGKGAAIGALVGGGGGLAYDRATHKKVVTETR